MSEENPRFNGIQRLVGADGLQRLREAHGCVVGLGTATFATGTLGSPPQGAWSSIW